MTKNQTPPPQDPLLTQANTTPPTDPESPNQDDDFYDDQDSDDQEVSQEDEGPQPFIRVDKPDPDSEEYERALREQDEREAEEEDRRVDGVPDDDDIPEFD